VVRFCALIFFLFLSANAGAQGGPPILQPGNAAVAGFSGAKVIDGPPPAGAQPFDKAFIDLDGPSLRVIDLARMGGPAQGQFVGAQKPFTVTSGQIGQVFSVALDDATPPNIYAAATSAYGLPIVVPDSDGDGRPDRARRGAPNAAFMPGLFGPVQLDAGPGSIWRIDGRTGAVTLFANVNLAGVPNSGPALGGLAFDAASRQLFAADRDTGMIHRFTLDGVERGLFDHGVTALTAAGLPPAPFDPRKRLNLEDPAFDTAAPATWAYAPPVRRVFGIATRGGRLYYAVAAGLRIWSVTILPDGSLGTDATVEVQIPPGSNAGAEISDITFDDDGRMLLAERGAPTGAYNFQALAAAASARTLRLRPKSPGAGGTPFFWEMDGEYAIGFPPDFKNTNGGVAIGYGYDPAGALAPAICGGTVWVTGEQLRLSADPAIVQGLAASGPLPVDGLQGHAVPLLRPQNAPPFNSWFIDYDDQTDRAELSGHLGDIAIWRVCGQAMLPLPFAVACPPGLFNVGGVCLFPLACPPGVEFADGCCIYRDCPPSYVRIRGRCVPPPVRCKPGETYNDGRCEAPRCPPGLVIAKTKLPNGPVNGSPRCPDGQPRVNDVCPPPRSGGVCTAPVYCECPEGAKLQPDGTCKKSDDCGPRMKPSRDGRECVCEDGYQWVTGNPEKCVPKSQCDLLSGVTAGCCPPGSHWNKDTFQCEPGSAGPKLKITKTFKGCCSYTASSGQPRARCSFELFITNIGTAPYSGVVGFDDEDLYHPGFGGSQAAVTLAPGETKSIGELGRYRDPGTKFMNCAALSPRSAANPQPPGPDISCVGGDVPTNAPQCQAEAPVPPQTPVPPPATCRFPTILINGMCCTREAIAAGTCGRTPTLPDPCPRGDCPTPRADLCPNGKPKVRGECPATNVKKCPDGRMVKVDEVCPRGDNKKKKKKPKPRPQPRPTSEPVTTTPPVQLDIGIGIGGGGRGGFPRPGGGGGGGRPPGRGPG